MKRARYLFRLDDITPTMHWGRFWAIMTLFRRFKVRPLLGVVPDNLDPSLRIEEPRSDFWSVLRQLRDEGLAEIAQHGYQHTLVPRPGLPIIGRRFGIKEMSEFAGDSFSSQLTRIDTGLRILEANGLATTFFMAPNHSFDLNTLRALRRCGFTAVSDGISLFPFSREGLTFVPQQLWRPIQFPCGTLTICLHSNELAPHDVSAIRRFLRSKVVRSDFSSEVSAASPRLISTVANQLFVLAYAGARSLSRSLPRQRSGSR